MSKQLKTTSFPFRFVVEVEIMVEIKVENRSNLLKRKKRLIRIGWESNTSDKVSPETITRNLRVKGEIR